MSAGLAGAAMAPLISLDPQHDANEQWLGKDGHLLRLLPLLDLFLPNEVEICHIAAALLPSTRAAHADSKYSKEFETCLSKCVYEQTKITKGIGKVEVMSRTEAYGMCKPKVKRRRAQERCFPCADPAPPLVLAQCATSKEQLLIGQPKKS